MRRSRAWTLAASLLSVAALWACAHAELAVRRVVCAQPCPPAPVPFTATVWSGPTAFFPAPYPVASLTSDWYMREPRRWPVDWSPWGGWPVEDAVALGRNPESEERERRRFIRARLNRSLDLRFHMGRLYWDREDHRFTQWADANVGRPSLVAPGDRLLFDQLVFIGDHLKDARSDSLAALLDPRDVQLLRVCVPADGTATARRVGEAGADHRAWWRDAFSRMTGLSWRGEFEVRRACRPGPLRVFVTETDWPGAEGVEHYVGRCARLSPMVTTEGADIEFRRSPQCEEHWRSSPGSFERHLHHELGHLLGFHHVPEPYNIMYPEVGQWDMPPRETALMRAAYAPRVSRYSYAASLVPALGVPSDRRR